MNISLSLLTVFSSLLKLFSCQLVTLHDGSPLFGREVFSETGKLVTEFFGVPFAEPPVGQLRFKKPKPKQPWRTPLNATKLPNSCVQSLDSYFGDFEGATMWNSNVPSSEDCLYLNIVVPGRIDPNRRLPVMVWVYGGGFWSGCATLDVYDGKILASEENVILVSMNYRVSVFGFLYMGREEAPGNMGLWDQLLSLKWVHKNIDLFGGDAHRVTLFGESAGAAAVSMHLLSPKSAPYFQRAILQSGSATAPWAMESRQVAIARSIALYEDMRCGNMSKDPQYWDLDKVLRCLMDAPAELIRDSEWAPVMEFVDFPWVPVIDGDFLIEQPSSSLKQGNFKTAPLLAGSNLDESIYFIVYQLADVFPPKDLFTKKDFIKSRDVWLRSVTNLLPRQMIKSSIGLASIIHEYEPADLPVKPVDWMNALDKMLGDLQFTCNVNEFALANSVHGGDTYYYYFTHRATQQTWPAWMGVLHGYEINFLFGEPFNTKRYHYTREEQELSSRFMRYWANFARSGNPNRNPDGTYTADVWPQYTQSSMEYMNLTVESDYNNGASRVGTGPRRKQCAFWKNHLPNLLAAVGDMGEQLVRWKQELDRWQNEYIVDWQLHFEQYKKYQSYRYADSDN
uniref:Carboxylic ester hydrolase n=1 Tax=Parascaris univalens TaxID=6257 RepID=A0A915BGM0_PARUN